MKVDIALNSAHTLQRTPSELGSESEDVAKASELKSLKDKRAHAEVHGHDVDQKVVGGKWVLKRPGDVTSKARHVLRDLKNKHDEAQEFDWLARGTA